MGERDRVYALIRTILTLAVLSVVIIEKSMHRTHIHKHDNGTGMLWPAFKQFQNIQTLKMLFLSCE